MTALAVALLLLVGCTARPLPVPPPQLTPAQRAWARDVCVPSAILGGRRPDWAADECLKAARGLSR